MIFKDTDRSVKLTASKCTGGGGDIPVTGHGGPWGCDVKAPTFSRQSPKRQQ
jgi:hypothetical protein